MGLRSIEIAKTALKANMAALEVVSHNVANSSTEGYTRQEIKLAALSSGRPIIPNDLSKTAGSSGVDVVDIERVRNAYLDDEIRQQYSKRGTQDAINSMLDRIDKLLANQDSSIMKAWQEFWKSWEDLSANPEDMATRNSVVEKGKVLIDTIKTFYNNLEVIQNEANEHIKDYTTEVNKLLSEISSLNIQIKKASGSISTQTNDLYDKRELLFQKLSEILQVNYRDSEVIEDGRINMQGDIILSDDAHANFEVYEIDDGKWGVVREGTTWNSNPEVAKVIGLSNPQLDITVNSLPQNEHIMGSRPITSEYQKLSDFFIRKGTFKIRGTEFTIASDEMTVGDLVNMINNSNIGVKATVTRGRFELYDLKGEPIDIESGTSNLWQQFEVIARQSGEIQFPQEVDEHLNINATIEVNGKIIRITKGANDTLQDIVNEINSNVHDVKANIFSYDGKKYFSLESQDKLKAISIRLLDTDAGEDLLYKLGLSNFPGNEVNLQGGSIEPAKKGVAMINGNRIEFSGDTIDFNGTKIKVFGTGRTRIEWRSFSSEGKIAGLVKVRDEYIEDLKNQLQTFTAELAKSLNELHFEGFGLDGNTSRAFFNLDYSDPINTIQVNPELVEHPEFIAASGYDEKYFEENGIKVSKGPGDNTNALRIAAIKNQGVIDGMKPDEFLRSFETNFGILKNKVQNNYDLEDNVLSAYKKQREDISGVSLDEELSNMIIYQKAYSAAARIVSVSSELYDTVINMVR